MSESTPQLDPEQPTKIDPTVAHSARVWNYWLGGKDNFAADRQLGDQILKVMPALVDAARADRAFLGRAVRHLVAEAGIRQFLDIGTGLPTADGIHEVAQTLAPDTRVVYVDNDPIVLTHARALLVGTPEGPTDYIEADIRDVDLILEHAGRTLDFDRPVGLMLLGVLNFIPDDAEAVGIVRRLLAELPSGSHLVVAHPTAEVHTDAMLEAVRQWNEAGTAPMALRSPKELGDYFAGLDILPPGIVSCSQWRAAPDDFDAQEQVSQFCAVARKP
ncbi:SAM-dependent methyltransferase [Sphaerisporangium aureirubrum]|uniref:SAM-dependent methyltransferase n=1 Tax=Sphaerisporangium aureirubrum TaxID=1544736 RepID=A0ABW1NFF2_9ACTN